VHKQLVLVATVVGLFPPHEAAQLLTNIAVIESGLQRLHKPVGLDAAAACNHILDEEISRLFSEFSVDCFKFTISLCTT
jgi:hypothetical protein